MADDKGGAGIDHNELQAQNSPSHIKEGLVLAAEGNDAEHALGLWASIKKHPWACFWSIAISTSIIMEGYDIVLISSLFGQPAFAQRYGEYIEASQSYQISAKWQSALSNGTGIGTIIGAFLNGYLTTKFGYKKTLLASLAFMTGAIFIPFFSPSIEVLLVGQIMCGIPWGVFATSSPSYASEICPTALRGYLAVYVNLTWAFGQLVSAGVMSAFSEGTSQWAYRIPFAIQWTWPIPIAVMVFLAPESPWYHVRNGNVEAAKRIVARLQTQPTPDDLDKTVAMMVHTNELEKQIEEGTSYWDCFKGVDRRRTEIACMVFAAQPFCGSAMGGTPTYFFLQAGLPVSISFKMSVGGLALACVGTLISWKLMHSFGRRTLYLWGLGSLSALLCIVGFISVGASHSKEGNFAQAAMMLLWLFIYYMSVGPICYAIITEASSTRLRSKSVCLSRIAYYIAQIISNAVNPFMLNPTAGNWKGKTGFVWGGCAFLFFVWTFFRLPEMKDRTYEELDVLFAKRTATRAFKKADADPYASQSYGTRESS
ncbi:putative major facilitator, sugar transporter, major facilitator superfamily [Septoria linicola]|nr:putative major facilitator, sugar transporter, major facilitator superfamily [Septoria linicola]